MNEFTCPLCFQIHQMPKNGFPLNKAFIELIQDISIDKINEINKDQFDKSINIEYLKFNLKNLKMEIDKIDSMIKNPSDELYEYCANLKREVQLSTEIKIENMNKLNDQFIKQIDEFEKKCSKNMKTEIKVDLNKMQQQNVSFNEFYNKCLNDLMNNKLNKFELTDAIQKVESIQLKLEHKMHISRSVLFKHDSVLEFESNTTV